MKGAQEVVNLIGENGLEMTGPMYVHFIILVCQFVDPSQIVFTIGVGNNNNYWFLCKLCMQKYITFIVIRLTLNLRSYFPLPAYTL